METVSNWPTRRLSRRRLLWPAPVRAYTSENVREPAATCHVRRRLSQKNELNYCVTKVLRIMAGKLRSLHTAAIHFHGGFHMLVQMGVITLAA